MRIAIDARAAAEVPAGRGRYVRELLRALAALDGDHEYRLYARREWEGAPADPRFSWELVGAGGLRWPLAAGSAMSRWAASRSAMSSRRSAGPIS
jgi:hypothetical protein